MTRRRDTLPEHPIRAAFDHEMIGKAVVAQDGRFVEVNPAFCRLFGYREDELLNTSFLAVLHPDEVDTYREYSERLWRGELTSYRWEKRYLHRRHEDAWLEFHAAAAPDDQGRPRYAIVQVHDITERKQQQLAAERGLERLRRRIGILDELRRALAGLDADVDLEMLRAVTACFDSPHGIFARTSGGDLSGDYLHETGARRFRCGSKQCNEAWRKTLAAPSVHVIDEPLKMGCGRTVMRSLMASVFSQDQSLGLFHLGDAPQDYDADDCELMRQIVELLGPALRARRLYRQLTRREAEVLQLIVSGMSQKQISHHFEVSVQTVAKHRAKVLEKLNVRNDVELVHFCLKMRALAEGTLAPADRGNPD